jgi:hypothetical protein
MKQSLTRKLAKVMKGGNVVHSEVVSVNENDQVFKGSIIVNGYNTPAYNEIWYGQMNRKGDTITLEPYNAPKPFTVLAFNYNRLAA